MLGLRLRCCSALDDVCQLCVGNGVSRSTGYSRAMDYSPERSSL